MKKSKLSIGLFVLLFSITGLFIGLSIARFFISPEAGLAAGPAILGYGISGFLVALIVGLFVHRFLNQKHLNQTSILFGLFNLGMVIWIMSKS